MKTLHTKHIASKSVLKGDDHELKLQTKIL